MGDRPEPPPWNHGLNSRQTKAKVINLRAPLEEPKKGKTMNYSTAVMLLNPAVRAIACSYEPGPKGGKPSTYVFKTLDPAIKPGDYVVVPTETRWEMTINRVEEVDVEFDFDSSVQLKWIIDRIDAGGIQKILDEEAKAIEIIKKAENRKKREDLRANVAALRTEELQNLELTHMGAVPAIEVKAG